MKKLIKYAFNVVNLFPNSRAQSYVDKQWFTEFCLNQYEKGKFCWVYKTDNKQKLFYLY